MDIALINGENIDMLNKTIVKKVKRRICYYSYESNRFLRFIFNQVE
mgnify:FL=1